MLHLTICDSQEAHAKQPDGDATVVSSEALEAVGYQLIDERLSRLKLLLAALIDEATANV